MATGNDQPAGHIRLAPLRPEQAPQAGALLAASHADYPGFRHVLPDPDRRSRVLPPFLTASARDAAAHGHPLTARDGAGMLGVALWMGPGAFPLSGARKARMTPSMLRVLWAAGGSAPAFLRLAAPLEHAHPPEDVWYLQAMGVHPRARSRGVGTHLMAGGLERADAAGVGCYLQTSDAANIAYYERFGFTVTQPSIDTYPGGPTYIGMRRPPTGGAAEQE